MSCCIQRVLYASDSAVQQNLRFLKGSKGISTQDFRPLIAVVPCGIASRKNMTKGTEKIIFGQGGDYHRGFRKARSQLQRRLIAANLMTMV